jgi:hypothetical protein
MKKVTWLGLSLLLVVGMLLASCSTSTTTTTQTSTTASMTTMPPGGYPVLTVTEGSKVNNFSLMVLRALTSTTGNGGYMSQSGTITGPFSCQGVALTNLLNTVGGISEGDSVVFTSSDNYTQTLSYDQIINGNFNYYDTTGNPITPQTMPTLTLIYSENGTLLDNTHGPVELGMLSPQNILTDGSLWAKMVTTITVTSDTSGLNSSVTTSMPVPTSVTASTPVTTSSTTSTTVTTLSTTPQYTLPAAITAKLQESEVTFGERIPIPTYLPRGYVISDVQVIQQSESEQKEVDFAITNLNAPDITLSLVWDAGGMFRILPTSEQYEGINLSGGSGTYSKWAQLNYFSDHNTLWWDWTPVVLSSQQLGNGQFSYYELVLSASTSVSADELVLIAKSVQVR